MDTASPFDLALKHFDGSQSAMARAVGVTQPAIRKALHAKRVSAELAVKIETATGGAISRQTLRPDLWSADPAQPTREVA